MTKEELYQPVIDLFVKKRSAQKLTQKALAEKAQITEATLRRFEAGTGSLTIDTANAIAKALGLCLEPNVLLPSSVDSLQPHCVPKNIAEAGAFSKWTVLGSARMDKYNHTHVLCECECHRVSYVDATPLRRGTSTSCGKCDRGEKLRKKRRAKAEQAAALGTPALPNEDLRGMTFGYLLVLDDIPEKREDGHWWYKVFCGAPGCHREDHWMRSDKIKKAKTCGCHFGQDLELPSCAGTQLGFVEVSSELQINAMRPELKTQCVVCGTKKWVRVENLQKHIGISCRCAPSLKGRTIGKYTVPFDAETRTNGNGLPETLCEKENGNKVWVSTEMLLRTLANELKAKKR